MSDIIIRKDGFFWTDGGSAAKRLNKLLAATFEAEPGVTIGDVFEIIATNVDFDDHVRGLASLDRDPESTAIRDQWFGEKLALKPPPAPSSILEAVDALRKDMDEACSEPAPRPSLFTRIKSFFARRSPHA